MEGVLDLVILFTGCSCLGTNMTTAGSSWANAQMISQMSTCPSTDRLACRIICITSIAADIMVHYYKDLRMLMTSFPPEQLVMSHIVSSFSRCALSWAFQKYHIFKHQYV